MAIIVNMASVTKDTIVWDASDFLRGLHPNFSAAGSDYPIPLGTQNHLTFADSMNPFRYFGYASPGFNPTDVTGVSAVTLSPIRSIILAAEGSTYYGYGVNTDNLLFQMNATTGALSTSSPWPHEVNVGGTEECSDCITYSAKVGGTRASRVFYSYNDNGNSKWDVGMYALDGSTFDDDFMSTAPANPLSASTDIYPHPMIVGEDDILYIGNGNVLDAYDGASAADNDGEYIAGVLTLPDNFRITSFARVSQRLCLIGYYELSGTVGAGASTFYATRAMAYFWDYVNDDPIFSVDLNDNYATCGFEYKGTIGCFTQGRKPVPGSNQFSKLIIFNGANDFDVASMFSNNVPNHGAVDVVGETIMWNSQGDIYQFGSPYPGFDVGLQKVAQGLGTTNGAIRTLSTPIQVISTGTTTSGGLQKITTNFGTGSFATAPVLPVWPDGKMGKIKSVKVEFGKESTGGRSIDIQLFGNGLGALTVISAQTEITSTNIIQEYEQESDDTHFPKFQDLALIGSWASGSGASDAPILKRVTVKFDTINIKGT